MIFKIERARFLFLEPKALDQSVREVSCAVIVAFVFVHEIKRSRRRMPKVRYSDLFCDLKL